MTPEEELEIIRENALIALTYIAAEHNPDQAKREVDLKFIRASYPKDRIDRGVYFLLNAVLGVEAASIGISMSERINQLRRSMNEDLQLE